MVLAEDTRRARVLFSSQGLPAGTLKSCYAANETSRIGETLAVLKQGSDAALISDAGTPGISDPGYRLTAAVRQAGYAVQPIPGPSAVTAALSASGFSGDRFSFLGFPPRKEGGRRRFFEEAGSRGDTLVFFESPHRIHKSLGALAQSLPERRVILFRELTKKFEEALTGTAAEILENLSEKVKGEIVVVVESEKLSQKRMKEAST